MLPIEVDVLETESASTLDDQPDDNFHLLMIIHLIREKYHDGWEPWQTLRQLVRATPEERERLRANRYGDIANMPMNHIKTLSPRQIRTYKKLFLKTPLMREIILEILCMRNMTDVRRRRFRRKHRRQFMPMISDRLVELLYSEWTDENQTLKKILKEKNPRFVPGLIK